MQVLASEYGARVTIHAPGELSYPQSDGFNVGIGRMIEIGVRYREQYRLKAPYESNCSANFPKEYIEQQLIPPNINYTLTTCKMACTDFYLKKMCGCVQYRYSTLYRYS